ELGRVQVVQVRNDAVQERPPWIELDRSDGAVSQPPEVAVEMEQQVHPGHDQQHPACDALERDQPQKAPAAWRIGCPGHHQPLSPWTDGRTNADGCSTRTIGVLADIRLLALPGPEGGVAVYGRRRGPRATVEARARRSRSRVTRLSSMI